MSNKSQHKRRNSQLDLFYPEKIKSKGKQNKQPSIPKIENKNKKTTKGIKNGQNISTVENVFKLVADSDNKIKQKAYIVEKINSAKTIHNLVDQHHQKSNFQTIEDTSPIKKIIDRGSFQDFEEFQAEQENQNTFFQFGKGRKSIEKPLSTHLDLQNLNMQQITEVPDTMSNSRRYQTKTFCGFSSNIRKSQATEQQDQTQPNYFYQKNQGQKTKPSTEYLRKENKRKSRKKKIPLKNSQQTEQLTFDFSGLALKSKKKIKDRKQNKTNKIEKSLSLKQNSKNRELSTKKQPQSARLGNKKINKNNIKKDFSVLGFKSLKHQKSKPFQKEISLSLGNKKKSLPLKEKNTGFKENPKVFKGFLNSQSRKTLIKQKASQNNSCSTLKQTKNSTNLKQKIRIIQENQSKLQKQYKMLWQCVGDLWQNNRITRYISQKNKADLIALRDTEKKREEDLLNMKGQIISKITSARY